MPENKKIGLALGAGAARGFAHVGIVEVFEEEKIPISVITGTSMGALIGGLYASGIALSFIKSYVKRFDISRFLDFTLREGGIVKGRRIEELLKIFTGNCSIEQLKIPFSCAAIDVTNGTVKNFMEGGLYEAIRASISIPGIFAPYEIDGVYYIDGGPLERIPIDACKALGAEFVIAVDVSWRGQDLPVPKNAIQSMQSALSITGWCIAQENQKKADIELAPDVFHINPFSSKEFDACVEAGRAAALAALPEIKDKLSL